MTRDVLDYRSPRPLPQARAGIVSLVLSLVAALALVGVVLTAPRGGSSPPEPGGLPDILAIAAFVAALVGFIFGLLGVRQVHLSRTLAYVGVVQNAVVLLIMTLGIA